MARQRRSGLSSLLQSTLKQAGTLKDVLGEVLDRGAKEGRARLEDFRARSDRSDGDGGGWSGARGRGESRWEGGDRGGERRSSRKRADAVAELGELVLQLIRDGEIDLGELPEARELVEFLDDVDRSEGQGRRDDGRGDEPSSFGDGAEYLDRGLRTRIDHSALPSGGAEARGPAATLDDDFDRRGPSYPPSRSRFDERRPAGGSVTRSMHAQPHPHHHHDAAAHEHPEEPRNPRSAPARAVPRAGSTDRERSEGTVSSSRWSPPNPPSGTDSGRVWRPAAPTAPPASAAKHGIRFDDDPDGDLADYMHPDDLPPKPGKP